MLRKGKFYLLKNIWNAFLPCKNNIFCWGCPCGFCQKIKLFAGKKGGVLHFSNASNKFVSAFFFHPKNEAVRLTPSRPGQNRRESFVTQSVQRRDFEPTLCLCVSARHYTSRKAAKRAKKETPHFCALCSFAPFA